MQLVLGSFQERRGKFGGEGSSLRFGDGVEEILPSQRRSIWRGAEERRDVGVSTPSQSWILLTLLILVLSMCFGRVSGTNVSPSRPSRAATAANAGGAGTRAVTGVQKAKRPKGHVKRSNPTSAMPADASSCGPHRSLSPRVDHSLETKGYPHEFGCSVCLDLAWKPVVLPCGHIFCFWCCHRYLCPHIQFSCRCHIRTWKRNLQRSSPSPPQKKTHFFLCAHPSKRRPNLPQ